MDQVQIIVLSIGAFALAVVAYAAYVLFSVKKKQVRVIQTSFTGGWAVQYSHYLFPFWITDKEYANKDEAIEEAKILASPIIINIREREK